ncbi:MAG: RNA repair domain-containing protein [Candidatus Bathyarchaeota archaeon]
MTIRDILNKLLWDPKENIVYYELAFIHRGAPMDVKVISCSLIAEVESSGFTYKNEEEDEEVFIPFHRVLEIRNVRTGQVIYNKRARVG